MAKHPAEAEALHKMTPTRTISEASRNCKCKRSTGNSASFPKLRQTSGIDIGTGLGYLKTEQTTGDK